MKAYVLDGIGEFNKKNVEKPSAGSSEVIVNVKAAGICGSDIPRVYKTGTYHFPTIPGHEFAGVVEDSFANANNSHEFLGKRVGIFPLIPCMKCSQCQKKQYEMCTDYNYLGSRTDGGFAEYVKVPEWNLIELPENVTFEQAAMLEPMAVAVHAARRAGLISSNNPVDVNQGYGSACLCENRDINIAVMGLGTIGLLLVMFLKSEGYKNIFVIGNKDSQKNASQNIGIDNKYYIDSKEILSGSLSENCPDKFDVFFDCVGTNTVINTAINFTVAGGTIVLVGNPASDIDLEKKIYWQILRRQIKLIGTWNSSFTHDEDDDWHYALSKINRGDINPEQLISHKMLFDNLIQGFEIMRDKSEEYIKIMMVNE